MGAETERLAAIEAELRDIRIAVTRADTAHSIAQGVRYVRQEELRREKVRILRDQLEAAERAERLSAGRRCA